ncbi:MAG: hypothetical protein H6738_00105 [Alphaproteobacteria bacterium]|nr:hypothetical protein [Alphaproteobacteria bacterium]MCB9695172.1 hypothetical protein [Alphaproteobacteria bacterium]
MRVASVLPLVISTLLLSVSAGAAEPPVTPAQVALRRLDALVGDWQADTPGGTVFPVSYRWMSSGSVLVETYGSNPERQTLTVFHLDGSHLVATHYCGQGNQPRLWLDDADKGSHLAFGFHDATNLEAGASHLVRLQIDLVDADHFRRLETYAAGNEEETTVLELVRKPSP